MNKGFREPSPFVLPHEASAGFWIVLEKARPGQGPVRKLVSEQMLGNSADGADVREMAGHIFLAQIRLISKSMPLAH
jgi:hypothetical protein